MTSFFSFASQRCIQQRNEQQDKFRRKLVMQRIHRNIRRDRFSHPLFPFLSSNLPTIQEETPCYYPRNAYTEKEALTNEITNDIREKKTKPYQRLSCNFSLSSLCFLLRQTYPFPHHFPLRS